MKSEEYSDMKNWFKKSKDSQREQAKQLAKAAYLWRQQQDLQLASIIRHKQQALQSSSTSSSVGKVPETFSVYFRDLFAEAHKIMVERQASYGPGNVENLGPVGVFSRMAMDKVGRIANALNGKIENGKLVVDEDWYSYEVHDALIDTINYAAILIALGQGTWSNISREGTDEPA